MLINNTPMLDVLKKCWIDDIILVAVAFLPSEKNASRQFYLSFCFQILEKATTALILHAI